MTELERAPRRRPGARRVGGLRAPARSVRLAAAAVLGGPALAGLALGGVVPIGPVAAAPSAAPSARPGSKVCTISDQRLSAVSGLTATKQGYEVINNTGGNSMYVYRLDPKTCQVTSYVVDSRPPYDPEDLGATPDGTLWVADTGDKDHQRQTVALWKFKPGESQGTLYRMTYPSGSGHKDAKALLMQPDGTPIIVTYEAGVGHLYEPSAPLDPNAPTPLKAVGKVSLKATGTPGGPFGPVGQRVFTGGAVSPNGKRVVLRTYTDAYEWTVTGKNIVRSLTHGAPRRTPLPNEPAGEAISYSADGSSFLTVSDGSSTSPDILRYTPAAAPAPTHKAKPAATDSGGGLLSHIHSLSDITTPLIGVGVFGLILLLLGIFGIRRSRRRPPSSAGDPRDPGPHLPDDAETVVLPRVSDQDRPPPTSRLVRGEPVSRRHRYREERPPDPSDADTTVIGRVADDTAPPPRRGRRRDIDWLDDGPDPYPPADAPAPLRRRERRESEYPYDQRHRSY